VGNRGEGLGYCESLATLKMGHPQVTPSQGETKMVIRITIMVKEKKAPGV
jgi:hypothetical protein